MFNKQNKKAPTEKQDVIADILKSNSLRNGEGICVALTGGWGIGKSYRWENSIKPALGKRSSIYISCFGKSKLSDIKLELLDKIIKSRRLYIKLFLGAVISIVTFVILSGIIFGTDLQVIKNHWLITLIIILIASVIVTFCFYVPLIKYFSNKIIGVDHNNIDFARFYKRTEKPILCFDDIERMSEKQDDNSGILGFIDDLKKSGYPILLIFNHKFLRENENEWLRFEEKVIYRLFIQENTDYVFNCILSEYDLSEKELHYIKSIYNNFMIFEATKDSYEDKEADFIDNYIKYNFRLLKKIIDNIVSIRKHIKNYVDLDPNISDVLLSYIGLYTTVYNLYLLEKFHNINERHHIDSDIKNSEELEIFYDKVLYNKIISSEYKILDKTAKKIFGNVLVTQSPINYEQLQPIKHLLKTSESEEMKINIELTSTNTEKLIQNFDPLYKRTPEIKKKFKELHDTITKENEPFSSISSMGNILQQYCYLYYLCGNKFTENSFTEIIKKIESFIKKHDVPLNYITTSYMNLISESYRNDNPPYSKSIQYLNSKFKELIKRHSKNKLISDDNFFNNYIKSYHDNDSLMYLYVFGTDKTIQDKLSNMKKSDYTKYIEILNYLIGGIKTWTGTYKNFGFTKDVNKNIHQWILNEINSITTLPQAGKAEKITQEALLEELDKVSENNYTDK